MVLFALRGWVLLLLASSSHTRMDHGLELNSYFSHFICSSCFLQTVELEASVHAGRGQELSMLAKCHTRHQP